MFKKQTILMLVAGLMCSLGVRAQVIPGAEIIPIHFPYPCYLTALSDNGDWAVASGNDENDQSASAYPYLVNAKTGELTRLWPQGRPTGITAYDVTDDGNIVVGNNNGAAYFTASEGMWTLLPVSSGVGTAYTVTPDGKYIAGYAASSSFSSDDYVEVPLFWERQDDGTYKQIDVYSGMTGFPRLDADGRITGMVRITNMSADGNILAGAMNFIYPNMACYYVYNRTTGQTFYIDNYMTELGYSSDSFIDDSNISNDGTYITGLANVVGGAGEYTSAYRFNIANQTFDLYNAFSDEQDRGGNAVSNAGTVFAASPAVNPLRYDYVRVGNLWYGLDEIISGRYGINIYNAIGVDYTGTIVDVSDDERVIAGMAQTTGDGYIVRLPETFAEAASYIDPMAAYAIYPEAGSQFARFRTATLTFSKPTSLVSGARAQLLDSTGKVLRNFNISANADGVSFIVGGIAQTLTAGETYTLCFPAGTFMLSADNSYTNKEIRINYQGRENTPTQMTGVSPADGANVSSISTNNSVIMSFDMNVQVATDADGNAAVGYLYELGDDTPLCELIIAASGNRIVMAPSLDRYLREGVDYQVVLPPNAVTDIMGDCGNDSIKVTYHGTYVPELSVDANLFYDNFDDPARSMATYLLYEGDHNTPGSVASAWVFDADNTPWNFTIRDNESSIDYCVASHSMYSPAGKSDDWMSLPQLYIENDDYYLSFAAQSYLQNKMDTLEIIALEEDGGYSAFTADLYEAFAERGVTVFKERLTPGSSENNLTDDWTHYEVSLADFAGKSVYLAFVNRNDDQSAIFVDSIRVYYNGDFYINNSTPSTVVNAASVPVTISLKVSGEDTYNDLTATCSSADGSFTSTYTASNLSLTSQSGIYEIAFPEELPLTVGEQSRYSVAVTLDGTTFSQNATIKDLAFETTKRVVVEKATGMPCGYCPNGILAFENLERLFGEKFIPVEIHSTQMGSDAYAYDSYVDYFGVTALPQGVVNRIDTIYGAVSSHIDPVSYNTVYSFNSVGGNETWLDIVQREFTDNPYADADVSITVADCDTETGQFTVEGTLNYAVNLNSLNQRLVVIIQENQLAGTQNNNYASWNDDFFGEWIQGGIYGQGSVPYVYNHVARRVVDDSFGGLANIVPVSVSVNEPVTFSVTRSMYDDVSSWANAEAVVMLVDATTGRAVNSAVVPFTVNGVSGISTVGVSGGIDISAKDGMITVCSDSDVDVALYDVNGRLVGKASGDATVTLTPANGKGLYIVKATAEGATKVRKVLLK